MQEAKNFQCWSSDSITSLSCEVVGELKFKYNNEIFRTVWEQDLQGQGSIPKKGQGWEFITCNVLNRLLEKMFRRK